MSHTGNGENDFEDLVRLGLDEETEKAVVEVRILARKIINRLEPLHMNSYPNLIMILEDCLEEAKRDSYIFYSLQKNKRILDRQKDKNISNQRTIGVIVDKGSHAKGLPEPVSGQHSNRPLLKNLFNAIGKPAPWEIPAPSPRDENHT